ncbi:MAG TPA: hypothetical protein VJ787_04630 [Thermoleophilia bacterium]|nr:hypothetical protein [Thermoleophilia bacterium]
MRAIKKRCKDELDEQTEPVRVSDSAALFFRGAIVEYGETRQAFENPAQKRTETFVTGRGG